MDAALSPASAVFAAVVVLLTPHGQPVVLGGLTAAYLGWSVACAWVVARLWRAGTGRTPPAALWLAGGVALFLMVWWFTGSPTAHP
jgi:hypothetical protein